MQATLLVELLTEELPPKSLQRLSQSFCGEVVNGLARHHLRRREDAAARMFATPRRLAVIVPDVLEIAADRESEITGPSIKAPQNAVEGFARKNGVAVDRLEQTDTPKGKVFLARVSVKGAALDLVLANIVGEALGKLPIPKLMRWGAGEAQFVRPVHGLVMMHGKRIVPGTVLGIEAGSQTRGHRFMGQQAVQIPGPEEYEALLEAQGSVIADFAKRRALIDAQLRAAAAHQEASLGAIDELLDEVTALVEHPTVYVGEFDAGFLEVPQECLILTMQQNQKYFPLFGAEGRLLPKFLIVSNMRLSDPRNVVQGNQRVVRPRLEDARFFYDQDRKTRLEERVPLLAKVVYHNKLGSQLERVERLQLLSGAIARRLDADPLLAERAAWLAKADLLSSMVGEFPELQGIMGRYYALHDGENASVADAIQAHYRPRFAGDRLPEGGIACAVALADKLDPLAGLFGIGQTPTGDKDPFGLRRAALGVVRILVEHSLSVSLTDLVHAAFAGYKGKLSDARADLHAFILERFSGYLRELGYSALQVDSVLSTNPVMLHSVPRQLDAVRAFQSLPEAESLAAANKRVVNILKQAESKGDSFASTDTTDLPEPAERALQAAIRAASATAGVLFERGDYTGYLKAFSVLKAPVDAFFDSIMVMVEDDKLRHGRLALLRDLRAAMNRVADISRLAT